MFIDTTIEARIKEIYFRFYASEMTKEEYYLNLDSIDNKELQELYYDYTHGTPYTSELAKGLEALRIGYSHRVYKGILRSDMRDAVQSVQQILCYEDDNNSYLVGGCVRDSIRGHVPKDFDFVTDIPYDVLEEIFTNEGYKVQEEGKQFLVMIISKNGNQFEIANFRKDGTYSDGRRPESVDIGTIEDDCQRRDFTVNALYWNLRTAMIEDPTSKGVFDMEDKLLRFIGKPEERLKEDNLRAYRFYRFLGKGFKPDKKSLAAVRTQFINDNIKIKESGVQGLTDFERIRIEIERMVGL